MSKFAYIFFILIFCLASCASDTPSEKDIPISKKTRVLDKASILTKKEKKELEQLLQSYADSSNLEFRLYTVQSLGPEQSIQELSIEAASEFKAGDPGLNNGATILLAAEDRQAKVEVNYGLEWEIPIVDAEDILQKMIPNLGKDQYLDAFMIGFRALHEAGKIQSWQVDYPDITTLAQDLPNAVGKIVTFKSRGLTRGYNSVPLDIQFSPELFIELKPTEYEGDTFLIFSNYMVEMVNAIIYADEAPVIYARVADLEPLQLQLLGIQ